MLAPWCSSSHAHSKPARTGSKVRTEESFLHSGVERKGWAPTDVRTCGELPAPSFPPATMAMGQSPYIAHSACSGVAIVDSYDVVMAAEIKAGLEFLPFKLKYSFLWFIYPPRQMCGIGILSVSPCNKTKVSEAFRKRVSQKKCFTKGKL